MKTDEELWAELEPVKFQMFATRGKNLIAVGWHLAVLRCAFASKDGARFYEYSGVPMAEYLKLKDSPFPDRLFTTNIKGKYPVVKEDK